VSLTTVLAHASGEWTCKGQKNEWQPYLRVIRERSTNAVNILDRFHIFHIVAKMNEALDDVRAAEARRLVRMGHEPV
jgi:hypothetical protein